MRYLISCALLLLLVGNHPLAAAERVLADSLPPGSDELPHDKAFVWGQLDNGLRYVVRSHEEPDNQISMRLLIYMGALDETDAEQGLAHYLEHLAFKGSDHFPDNSFVEAMQRAGVSHGSHSNAHTGFDETVYKLDVAADDAQLQKRAAQFFRDVLVGLHISEAETESERGVILAEKRDRESADFRAAQQHFARRYPGMRLSQRWPIGTEEVIKATDHEQLRALWQRWYRLDNAVLSVVGDAPVEELETLVSQHFAAEPAPAQPLPEKPAIGTLPSAAEPVFSLFHDPELAATTMRIYALEQSRNPAPSLAAWRQSALASLAGALVSRRLREEAETTDAPILDGAAGMWWWHDLHHAVLSVQVREQQAAEALTLSMRETRKLMLHGPQDHEVETVIAQRLAQLRQGVATASNRSSDQLAVTAYQAVKNNENILSPQQELQLWQDFLDTVTVEDLRQFLASSFQQQGRRWTVEVSSPHLLPEEPLAEAFAAVWAEDLVAEAAAELPPWPYAPAEQPATPTEQEELPNGLLQLAFAPGVQASILPREEHAQEVLLQLRIAREPGTAPAGVRRLSEQSFLRRGTGALTRSQISRHLAGSTLTMNVAIADDAVVLSGSALPEEVEDWLVYAQALITDPGWREDRIEDQRQAWLERLRSEQHNLEAQVRRRFNHLTTGGASDRALPSVAEVEALSVEEVQQWLAPILREGAIEVAVVGDLDTEAVTQALGRTIGSLPARNDARVITDLAAEGALLPAPPLPQKTVEFDVASPVSRAQIVVAWPTVDMRDIGTVRRLGQLSGILRVRLREQLRSVMGEAYSPYATHLSSDLWQDHGYLQAVVSVAPELRDQALAAITDTANELAENGVSAEHFEQVHRPTLTNLPTWRNSNRYWLGQVVGRAWTMPQRLDWAANMEADYAAITREQLSQLAAEVFTKEPLVVIGVSP